MYVKKGAKRFRPIPPADRSKSGRTAVAINHLALPAVNATSQPAVTTKVATQHGHDSINAATPPAGNQENAPNSADHDGSSAHLQPDLPLLHIPSPSTDANDPALDNSQKQLKQLKQRKRKELLTGVQRFRVTKASRVGDAVAMDPASPTSPPPANPPSASAPSSTTLEPRVSRSSSDMNVAVAAPARRTSSRGVPIPLPNSCASRSASNPDPPHTSHHQASAGGPSRSIRPDTSASSSANVPVSHKSSKRSCPESLGDQSVKHLKRHTNGPVHIAVPLGHRHKHEDTNGAPIGGPFHEERTSVALQPRSQTVLEEDQVLETDFTGHYANFHVQQHKSLEQQMRERQGRQPPRRRKGLKFPRCRAPPEGYMESLNKVPEGCDHPRFDQLETATGDRPETVGASTKLSPAEVSSSTVSIEDEFYAPWTVRGEPQASTPTYPPIVSASQVICPTSSQPLAPVPEIGCNSSSFPHTHPSIAHASLSPSSAPLQPPPSTSTYSPGTSTHPPNSSSLFDVMKEIGKEPPDECSPQMKALLAKVGAANPALLKYDPATRAPPTKEWPYLPEGVEQNIFLTPIKHRVKPLKNVAPLLKKREQYRPLPPLDPSLPRRPIHIEDVKQTLREYKALLEPKPRRKGETVAELRAQVEKEREFERRREAKLKR